MTAGARLVTPDGAELDPGALSWRTARLEPERVERARRHAFREGRVIERDGAAVLTWGVAARLEFPAGAAGPAAPRSAHQLLAAIPGSSRDDAVCPGPLALGALPFDSRAPSSLVIPRLAVVATPDAVVAVAVGGHRELADPGELGLVCDLPGDAGQGEPAPDRFRVDSVRPHADFLARVGAARDAIRRGELDKVVLVREVGLAANRDFRQHDLLERLRALHPSCAAFAIDGFVGASPELLVRRRGLEITSRPLAGTVARSGDRREDARLAAGLLASPKDRLEHRYVVDAVTAAFAGHADDLVVPDSPELLELRNVTHLATPVSATLRGATPGGACRARSSSPSSSTRPPPSGARRAGRPSSTSPGSSSSTGDCSPARSAGSTPRATGNGGSGSGPRSSTAGRRAFSPASASSRGPSPRPSSPRPS